MVKNNNLKKQATTKNLIDRISPTAAILFVIILLTIFFRLYTLDIPLERDEGEYAYAGQLILDGYPPYQHMYNMKLPGIYYTYAAMMAVFGQTPRGIHLGLLIFNAITIILVFQLVSRLTTKTAATAAAAFFAILSANDSVLGLTANAEHFVLLPALLGILFLMIAMEKHNYYLLLNSGLCLGISFVMKQQGIVFIMSAFIYLLISLLRFRPLSVRSFINQCLILSLGVAIPYILICIIMYYSGVFQTFWFWTVKYAQAYSSIIPFNIGLLHFKQQFIFMFQMAPLIWLMAFIGMALVAIDEQLKAQRVFIIFFVIFSFLAVCPGWYFRQHYFILFLPAIALLGGLSLNLAANIIKRFIRTPVYQNAILIIIIILCALPTLYLQRYIFHLSPSQISQAIYGDQPFVESMEISRIIRSYTTEKDSIAIMGSEPQIFFYSHRRSATGFIYMYPLVEPHIYALKMQKDMIREIEASKPQLLVYVNMRFSWAIRPDSQIQTLNDWFKSYQKGYKLIGIVDIFEKNTQYYLEPNVIPPKSPNFIALYERKTNS
jgi:hypothetical protein